MNDPVRKLPPSRRLLIEWLLLCGVLLLLGGIVAYLVLQERRGIEIQERERLTAQARVIHDNLARQIDSINKALTGIRQDLAIWRTRKNGMESANYRLRAMADTMSGVRTMLVLDVRGKVVVANREELLGGDFGYRDYFLTVLRNPSAETLYVSPPFKTSLGVFAMNVVRMIPGPRGEFNGIVSATFDPEQFRILLDSVRYALDMRTAIVHGEGDVFMTVPEQEAMAGQNLARPGTPFMRHRESGRAATVTTGIVLAGEKERMVAQRTFDPAALSMNKPLVIEVCRDLASIYASWWREVRILGGLYALLSMAAGIGLFLHQRRRRYFEALAARHADKERESAERLQLATEAAGVGVWDYDMVTGVLLWDDAMFALYGMDPAKVSSLYGAWYEAVLPEDKEAEAAALRASIEEGQPYMPRFRIRRGDGEIRTIQARALIHRDPAGHPMRLIGTNEDVTEREAAERVLRNALVDAGRFREALDHVSSYIYMKDREDRYVYANQPTLDLFGVSAEELVGSPDDRFFPTETVQRLREVDARVFEGEDTCEEIDVEDPTSGRRRVFWEVKTPIYTDSERKEIWGLCGISTDITERKLAEEELDQARAAAEAASEAKSQFLANMSHEIRTPMSAVLGLLELLRRSGLSHRQEDYAQKAQTAARSLLGILNDILDFSKVEAGRLDLERISFRLDELLQNLAVMLSATIDSKTGVEIRFDIDPSIPVWLRGDPLRLQQILLNLAGNAIKFTPSGSVVVSLRALAVTPEWTGIEFAVRDTGIGIPSDKLAELFEGFHQAEASTSRRFGGTGLGLAISQRLVRLMGGEIHVKSEPGQGSEFRFTLTIDRSPEAATAERLLAVPPVGRRLAGLRLLVVEDNPINRQVARELLAYEGATVEVAGDGREGIERVMASEPPFDAVLMDLQMPGMDGFEATRILRQEKGLPSLPIIAMTANAMPADREACLAAGMDDHVGKPIEMAELVATILRHCDARPEAVPHETLSGSADAALPGMPPGFEVEAAIERIGGNRAFFAGLARGFRGDQGGVVERVRASLGDGDRNGAIRELHTLKGVAATLGADALSRFAAGLESGLKAGADISSAEAELLRLETLLSEALTALEGLAVRLDAVSPPPEATPSPDPIHTRSRLLIVDDQPINVQILQKIFEADHEVVMSTGGERALELCREDPPDLILLDVVMPGMDGMEVCRRLKADPKMAAVPVIFVTAQDDPADETRGLEAGAVDFITKPVNPAVVRARVRAHLTLKAQADALRQLAFIDGLTGVANRRRFDDALEVEWRRCRRSGSPLAVVMIDIDHFKHYNDRYGHQAGDVCLRSVAGALGGGLRRSPDLVARYGGEEFVCLLPECDLEGARVRAEELRKTIEDMGLPHEASATSAVVTVSLGVASVIPGPEQLPEELVAAADAALYEAKLGGRNRVCTRSTPTG